MSAEDFDRSVPKSYPLRLLGIRLAVCKLSPQGKIPEWSQIGDLVSITCTPTELSIVCPQEIVPEGVQSERDWRAFEVIGPLDFSLVGVLATLASVLAEAGISIFALSTYNTDYLLVKEAQLERAVSALIAAGHTLEA
jgi:hypothetical protein